MQPRTQVALVAAAVLCCLRLSLLSPQVSKAAPNHTDPSLCSAFWWCHPSTRLHACLCTCCTCNLWLIWVLDNLFEAPSPMKAWARRTFASLPIWVVQWFNTENFKVTPYRYLIDGFFFHTKLLQGLPNSAPYIKLSEDLRNSGFVVSYRTKLRSQSRQ